MEAMWNGAGVECNHRSVSAFDVVRQVGKRWESVETLADCLGQ